MNLRLEAVQAARFARLALNCVTREYPNKIAHVLHRDADAKPPRLLTPAFYGCYDWHSAVHGHWLLACLARLFPGEPFAAEARAALARNITGANIHAEVLYMRGEDRAAFERPYGLAWLLTLATELRLLDRELATMLAPLEIQAAEHLAQWLPKLPYPDRSGQHANTAFALALALDWAGDTRQVDFERLIRQRARDFYAADRNAPLAFEPSGEDFLSPSLAEADLMRRVFERRAFEQWLDVFLPDMSALRPVASPDPADGKLAHLDGLNLSRDASRHCRGAAFYKSRSRHVQQVGTAPRRRRSRRRHGRALLRQPLARHVRRLSADPLGWKRCASRHSSSLAC